MKVIKGRFVEHEKVNVLLDGKQYTRTVYFNTFHGLYIRINNKIYFEYEVEY